MVQKRLCQPVLGCVLFNVLSLLQQDTRNDECLVLGAEASLLPLLIPGLFLLDPFSSI